MRKKDKGWIAPTLLGSAVAGAGLSFGRDAYKLAKDNWQLMLLAFVFMGGTVYGMWNMVRGHARGITGTLFRTVMFNGLIVLASVFCFTLLLSLILGADDHPPGAAKLYTTVALVQVPLALLGLIIGLIQRRRRVREIRTIRHNEDFLEERGFRTVGGNDATIIAPDGSELKFEDLRADAYVFKIAGRRSVRAKILIDEKGRMVEYVPA
ncbi:hypothetical protein ACFONL_13525 [Camelimonas fluminis]|uniref:NfeD-like C-terminal domain-containing protein n=1 Tax=Camelimonas fluminis TaxID=1576911 RepID=A0ABV7UIQ9_9HYPH|nr:hypothetical protein [Camelimonas fluminis]